MNSALDDVAFLALSENRIALLGELCDEETHTRDELMAATDVSRPTLGRILEDLEERAWITQSGQTVQITTLGTWVHDEFTDFLETMADARDLRVIERGLSMDVLPFGLRRLTDARITMPTKNDPLAPMHRASELGGTARESRLLTHALPIPCLNAHREAIASGDQCFEAVVTPNVVATMADTAHRSQFSDILDADQATVFVAGEPIPDVVGINDDVVYFGIDDEKGAPLALIESENETVRTWAEERFEAYREEALPLDIESIEADPAAVEP